MKKNLIKCSVVLGVSAIALTGCIFGKKDKGDQYDNGRLILNLRNLYFSSWDGSDDITDVIQEKFGVKIAPSSYDYNSWGEQVSASVNSNNLPDVFHFDLESFNFGNTYKNWANGKILKALPDDLSKWPKLKKLIENTSNINSLKLGGKLYGIPLAYNQDDPSKNYSSFTYVYRRDWAKQVGLYQENDIYTWDQFLALLRAFKANIKAISDGNAAAIADVSWGFPSLTNFYKESPHCYAYDAQGKVTNAFATDNYIKGLDITKTLVNVDKLYFDQVSNANNTKAYDGYKGGNVGVYYENLSLSNYSNLRKDYRTIHPTISEQDLDDATAIMKVKGPDGKYHLEGSENWFSMTFFNYDISDTKMNKILDIMEYLLTDEGTKLAIYGVEGRDYTVNDGEIELNESTWIKQSNGEYGAIINGAKYLREMVTLNNDTSSFDPFTDQRSYAIIKGWQDEMNAAKTAGNLVIFEEPSEIKWLSTPKKDANTSALIKEGNDNAMKYCYLKEGFSTKEDYKSKYQIAKWTDTISEINATLGK